MYLRWFYIWKNLFFNAKLMKMSKLKQNCQHFLMSLYLKMNKKCVKDLGGSSIFYCSRSGVCIKFYDGYRLGNFRFKCNQCEYEAKYQKYLKHHIQSKHMGRWALATIVTNVTVISLRTELFKKHINSIHNCINIVVTNATFWQLHRQV